MEVIDNPGKMYVTYVVTRKQVKNVSKEYVQEKKIAVFIFQRLSGEEGVKLNLADGLD